MNYYVYIIRSRKKNYNNIGLTSGEGKRIKQHNKGSVRSTKAYLLVEIIYVQEFESREKTRDYEKYLKIRSNEERLLRSMEMGRDGEIGRRATFRT
ncbi:MAG: GIY-YIG nuclease family protein [Patescibacteria group bacterium]